MKHDPDELFRKYQSIIHHLSNSFAASHRIEPTDLESIGDEVFVRCLQKWDPARAAFGTLFYKSLVNAYSDEVRKAQTRREREGEAAEIESTIQPFDSMTRVAELLMNVGADAQEVVRLLFDGDLPVHGRETRRNVRAAIRRLLRSRTRRAPENGMHVKWTFRRIKETFAELDEALTQ